MTRRPAALPSVLSLTLCLPLLAASCAQAPMRAHSTPAAPAALGPYSQAVQAGGFLFASGQVALRPDGSLVEGDVRAQTEQVMKNLDAVLAAAGCRRSDVVKCTVFLTDLGDFAVMNEVYADYFGDHKPARACVEVSRLPKDVAVEIELVAQVPGEG